jgi:hypothetical protein
VAEAIAEVLEALQRDEELERRVPAKEQSKHKGKKQIQNPLHCMPASTFTTTFPTTRPSKSPTLFTLILHIVEAHREPHQAASAPSLPDFFLESPQGQRQCRGNYKHKLKIREK